MATLTLTFTTIDKRRQFMAIAPDHLEEIPSVPIPWYIPPGIRKAAEEPTQVKLVCPHWYMDLVT
jgi:hypothetical protein